MEENFHDKVTGVIDDSANKPEPKLTKEQVELIKKGIRPDGMDFEEFKAVRKFMKNLEKEYKRGELIFVAQTYKNKKLGAKGMTYNKEIHRRETEKLNARKIVESKVDKKLIV